MLLAYHCGGYVAGRMACFDGLEQGLAVWLWVVAALAGRHFHRKVDTTGLGR